MSSQLSAAREVVTSSVLLPLIGSFLPGAPMWTVEYERKYGRKTCEDILFKWNMGAAGLLPRLAIERGDLRALKRLYALQSEPQYLQRHIFRFNDAMLDAIECGALDALEWLHKNTNTKCPQAGMVLAAKNGHNEIVQWLLTHYSGAFTQKSFRAVELAAKNGHVEVVKALYANGLKCCAQDTMDQVAANGHLEVLKFLNDNGMKGCSTEAVEMAATNGHLDVLRWLLETIGVGVTKAASYNAVVYDRLDILRYLCETATVKNQEEAVHQGMREAASRIRDRQVEMLAFLRAKVLDAFPWHAININKPLEIDAGANYFAPVASTTSTAAAHRAKSMPKKPAARAKSRQTHKPRTQAFLSLESTPDASCAN